jgi:hypothetical protein
MLYEEALESRYLFARRAALLRDSSLVNESDAAWVAIDQAAEAMFGHALADGMAARTSVPQEVMLQEGHGSANAILNTAWQAMQEAFRLRPEKLAEEELRLVAELMQMSPGANPAI